MIRLRVTLTLSLVFVSAIVLASLMVGLAREPADVPLAIGSFLRGIAGSPTAIGATGRTLTPVLLVGVAACISFRAGLFDVGQVGQFVLGGVVAGAVAAIAPGPGLLTIAISLSAGAATGGLWSLMVARVSAATGMQLVVLSLIANYLAEGLGRLATRTLFQDPKAYSLIATRLVPEDAWLATLLPRTSLHAGIIIALLAFAAMGVVLLRNSIGHRVTMFGYNPIAAALAGVRVTRFQSGILSVTGAICGAAGAIEVLGTFHRYQDASLGGPNSIAWTGVIAVILVPGRVLAVLPAAALLAALATGFEGIQRDFGIPTGLVTLMSGIVVVAAAFMARAPGEDPGATAPLRPRPAARTASPQFDGDAETELQSVEDLREPPLPVTAQGKR